MSVRYLLAGVVWLLTMTADASEMKISGRVTDGNGRALTGMSIRLFADSVEGCLALSVTDRDGHYRLDFRPRGNPPDPGERDFTVEALGHSQSSYVFTPARTEVTISQWPVVRDDVDFTGTFDFSNFQKSIRLTGDDFPELSGFDLVGDYVFLKVFTSDPNDASVQDLIFLGRVSSADAVLVEVSLARSVSELQYEIFGTTNSVNGTIHVKGWRAEFDERTAGCRTRIYSDRQAMRPRRYGP